MSNGPIINKINEAITQNKPFYSFEYFPPKTAAGVKNLFVRMDRMSTLEPTFMDVTWGAGGSTAQLTLEISASAQNFCNAEVMMHLTCTNMPKESVKAALEEAKKAGIRNILALRGDPPSGADQWEQCEGGFAYAVDLVKFIRAEYGDYFGIAVAGYPEGHIASSNMDEDLKRLAEKVQAGADFIITQLFYDVDLFITWVKKCRAIGITCPIVPGIMPIQNYNGFKRMTSFCKTHVPREILDALEPIKHDDALVKQYGIELGITMCKTLHQHGMLGLHFYTLNLERSVIKILEGLGHVTSKPSFALPWKQSQVSRRSKEDVRPIFWANRPNSYIDRSSQWDEFPNGRWGDSGSPAFGDLSDYHLCTFKTGKVGDRKKLWGSSLQSVNSIYEVFAGYIDGKVTRLPWCESAVQLETVPLKSALRRLNLAGYLTINSQPRVNGAPSDDPAVGWGGPGGYVYQKAYLEFFCSPDALERLLVVLKAQPSIQYHALDHKGTIRSNTETNSVTAVTWGVFPGKEIIQPTVVDTKAFVAWRDEAFALWKSQWQAIYEPGSSSWQVVEEVVQTFFLVTLLDNDYINGDIFKLFDKICPEPL